MDLVLDRDSVCMGDDAYGHAVVVEVPDEATFEDAIAVVNEHRFHWVRAGGWTSWLVRSGPRGRDIAAVCGLDVRYIAPPTTRLRDLLDGDKPQLYFCYELGRPLDELVSGASRHG